VIKLTFQKIDYIYMTGDIVDHGIWDTSIPKNTETIKKLIMALQMEFPNIPVYPILGNHEATPTNT
jgi:DNA repair exonuclease